MSFSPQYNTQDFSKYGFVSDEEEDSIGNQSIKTSLSEQKPVEKQESNDYSNFGFRSDEEKPKEKVGWAKSIIYGLGEAVLGIPGLIQYGVNEFSRPLEDLFYGEDREKLTFEQENPILAFTSQFPESEDESARRVRAGVQGAVTGSPFGIPGIIAGLIGSQAGQTVREVYGKDGKFDEFGWGEAGAIGADVVAGGLGGLATSIARGGGRTAAQQSSRAPAIFQQPQGKLQRAVVKNAIQGERTALENIINDFSNSQVRGFEQQVSAISPNSYTQLVNSDASALKRNADQMFKQTQLRTISPIQATPEQGGRAIQEAANHVFQTEVIEAENAAYRLAREAASELTGTAPRTIEEAKALRAQLTRVAPTSEQQPVIAFLDNLIMDLETTTPTTTRPASTILDASGRPLTPAQQIPGSTTANNLPANDLVTMVQNANQAVNYGSELRQQSHRLTRLVNTLRNEVGQVLRQNPEAANLYQQANTLHGNNAETWGTKYMRSVRFSENPESIVGKTKKASNMRNLKQGIQDPQMQALAERLVIEDITQTGSSDANRNALNNLAPELSPNARNAGEQLTQVKDPLTSSGGRAAIRNEILQDAAQSVSTGKRPERILDLMQTPKGYDIVRESMSGTRNSRELFSSFERLFIEDIFSSITDKTGRIDFSKARNIFKNRDVREVARRIGGDDIIRRFTQLEEFANNLARNQELYKSQATQSLFKSMLSNVKSSALIGGLFHLLGMPGSALAAMGIGKAGIGAFKGGYTGLKSKILNNPRALRALESITIANTTEELAKQLPRLIAELDKTIDDD